MFHQWLLWLDAMTPGKAGKILVVLVALYYLARIAIELVQTYRERRRSNRELLEIYNRNVAFRIQREGNHGQLEIRTDPRVPRDEIHFYHEGEKVAGKITNLGAPPEIGVVGRTWRRWLADPSSMPFR